MNCATYGTQDEGTYNTICVGHHYTQANINNVNKTGAPLQTAGGKDKHNIDNMGKLQRTSQHETQNIK